MDIISRSKALFDKLIIAVAKNSGKNPLFSVLERIEIIKNCCSAFNNVEAVAVDGLIADYCRNQDISCIIRGLRSTRDFNSEIEIAAANKMLAPGVETVFMMTSGEYACISSSIVREIAGYCGDISRLVPQFVANRIRQKYSKVI